MAKSSSSPRIDLSGWAVYTVWYRQFQAYKKTWLVNCLPSLTEPLVYLLAFGFGLGPVIHSLNYHGRELDYLSFIAPGMLGIAVVSQSYFEGAYGVYIRIRYERSWQALLTGPIAFQDIFFGEILWASTKGVIGSAATALVAHSFGVYPLSAFFSALPVLVCASILFAALGMFTAGIINSIDQVNVPTFLFVIPMMVICGTYFPQEGMPPALRLITGLMPLSALNQLVRHFLTADPYPVTNLCLLLGWTIVALFFSFRQIRKRVLL